MQRRMCALCRDHSRHLLRSCKQEKCGADAKTNVCFSQGPLKTFVSLLETTSQLWGAMATPSLQKPLQEPFDTVIRGCLKIASGDLEDDNGDLPAGDAALFETISNALVAAENGLHSAKVRHINYPLYIVKNFVCKALKYATSHKKTCWKSTVPQFVYPGCL
jgi:hypothetical protein